MSKYYGAVKGLPGETSLHVSSFAEKEGHKGILGTRIRITLSMATWSVSLDDEGLNRLRELLENATRHIAKYQK